VTATLNRIDLRKNHSQTGRYPFLFLLGICLVIFSAPVLAQAESGAEAEISESILLEEVLVEGSLMEDSVRNTPKNVSVITDTDIEQAPGKELIDILSSQAGLNIMSYSGNDKQSSIDLRGMGATANSNVLVIVDGIRLNAPDLSGADLSSIDLDTVAKIEIMRGPESVIYGDGAVAGVIKIYTKQAKKKPVLKAKSGIGSNGTRNASLNYSTGAEQIAWNANINYHDSEGYRENGFLNKRGGKLNLSYRINEKLTLVMLSSAATDEYGLPGPVSIDYIYSEEQRIRSNNPNDQGETTDVKATGGFDWKLSSGGLIKARRGYRFRENKYLIGYNTNSQVSREDQTSHIDEATRTLRLTFSQPFTIQAQEHRFKGGIDHTTSYYVRDSKPQNERNNSKTESLGAFIVNQWQLSNSLQTNLGFRRNTFSGKFRKDTGNKLNTGYLWRNGELIDKNWNHQSYSLGILFKHAEDTNLFFSLASSFRTPNVDEFAAADENLVPQTGQTAEMGIRVDHPEGISYSVSLFRTTMEKEIYYGTDSSGETENRNYDDLTIRSGLEAEFRFYPLDNLYLWGNASLLSATFEGSGKTVPLVPTEKGSLGAEIAMSDNLTLALNGTMVGSQYDGNDESNNLFEKLDAYSVFNTKLTYRIDHGKSIQFSVRNLFNTLYSTVAYSETYYPMPTRNYFCELNWVF